MKKLDETKVLDTLLSSLGIGVLIQGPNAEMIRWNGAVLELLGVSADQLSGRTSFDPEWGVIHVDGSDYPGQTHPVPQAIATGKSVKNAIMGVWRPSSSDRVWLLVNADPIFDDEGELHLVLCTFSDISERSLFDKNHQQLAKAEILSKMVSGVVHDMKNILSGILAYSDLAKLECEADHPVLASLRGIDQGVQHGAELSHQVLNMTLTRSSEGQECDLNEMVREVMPLLRSLMGDRCDLVVEPCEQPLLVAGEQVNLQQVLLNLAVNARDAMPSGGRCHIVTGREDSESGFIATLRVSDNGCGMPPSVLPHIFDLHYSRRSGGTGIGLATTLSIVESLGGVIDVESEEGAGSSFLVRLPIAEGNTARTPRQDDSIISAPAPGKRKHLASRRQPLAPELDSWNASERRLPGG